MYDVGYKTITTSNVFFTKFLEFLVYYAGNLVIFAIVIISIMKLSDLLPESIIKKLN